MVKKKVVKKKVAKKKLFSMSPKRIENMDLVEYFRTGKKNFDDNLVYIEGNVLSCVTNFPTHGAFMPVAVKVGGYTIINGDDVTDNVGEFEEVVERLQDFGDKEITTSFVCLKNAGVNLNKIKVLEIVKDLDVGISLGEKGFDDFKSTVPQGATYKEYPCGEVDEDEDEDENGNVPEKIGEKRYHRAGGMLIREGKHSYICGMDEDSYFVTKLAKNVTTMDKAFQSLKPKEVQQWEKKNKTQAIRQGEWFFLPTTLLKVKGMRRKGLPLWKAGGNKHIASGYVLNDGKHYVKGNITHMDHVPVILGDKTIHEAIMNTQLGSWSEQGVD